MKKSNAIFLIIISGLLSSVVTIAVIIFTGFTSTKDGIYAVQEGRIIELSGNAELPLYEEALNYVAVAENAIILKIESGYDSRILGNKENIGNPFSQLFMAGDVYSVYVAIESKDCFSAEVASSKEEAKKLSLNKRKKIAIEAIESAAEGL
jgi:hypothetical protein